MISKIPAGIVDASQLVRGGELHAATEAIQALLRGRAAPRPETNEDDVVEGSFHVVGAMAQPGATVARESAPHVAAPGAAPVPGLFLTRTYSNAAGSRDYKTYIPDSHHGHTLPMIVMLHGCTQNPDDFAAGTRMNEIAEERGFIVVYPQQPCQANASNCWNWFEAKDQQRDRGEPSIIAGITREAIAEYRADPRRVYVGGLSAGGAMAAIMGATYPDLYAAVGIHSGLAYGAASDMPSAFAAMRGQKPSHAKRGCGRDVPGRRVPTIIFHGDNDTTVHPSNGDDLMAQASGAGAQLHDSKFSGCAPSVERGDASGRTYTLGTSRDGSGKSLLEYWVVHGAAHAWFGGSGQGSYIDPHGPDASREMVRFFFQHQSS